MNTQHLKALEAAATPGKWWGEVVHDIIQETTWIDLVASQNTGRVGKIYRHEDAAFLLALQGAAPELLAMAAALQEIRDNEGRVCEEFEICTHVACRSSVAAWFIADKALNPHTYEDSADDVRLLFGFDS